MSAPFRVSREPAPEFIRERLDYDPETGVLTRRWRADAAPKHNKRDAGKVAGCLEAGGYIRVSLDGKRYQASRLAWIHYHGRPIPDGHEIDHEDLSRSNNRIGNLRLATISQQRGNQRHGRHGFPRGVKRAQSAREAYCAQIVISDGGRRKHVHLGTFSTADEARLAYAAAATSRWGAFYLDQDK